MTDGTAKPEVLIIGDEGQIRRLLRRTLESAGDRVRDAACDSPGLNAAAADPPAFLRTESGLGYRFAEAG
jgi:ActR/RegA family two-component response regulator